MIQAQYDSKNRNWWFRPLDRVIRGRFLLERVAEPTAMAHQSKVPREVPGQIVAVDAQKREGYLIEPAHEHPDLIEWARKRGRKFEDAKQTFTDIDVDEWLYFIAGPVRVGKVKLLSGELPESINYVEPKNYLAGKPKRGPERLAEVCREDPATAAAYVGMSKDKRQEFEQLIGV